MPEELILLPCELSGWPTTICGGWPFSDASGVSLFDPDTLAFLPANLDTEWVSKGYHADHATDTLRGGPENPALDADWFLLEVSPDAQGNALEMDVVVDFANNFDWATFNDHYWKE